MKSYLMIGVIASILMIGCSSSKESSKIENQVKNKQNSSADDFKKKAMEHFINGSIAEARGDYASAILEFQDALSLDPNAAVFYSLGKNYYNLNKLSLSIQNARKAVELNPYEKEYYLLLSSVYSSAKQFDSALVTLEKAIQLDTTDVEMYYKLARLYEGSKPLKAIETYEKITSIIGPDWNVLVHVAELYEKLGNLDAAVSSIEKLISLDPANVGLQKILIDFYQKANNFDKALSTVDDILELTPDDLEARERKAQILIMQNKWDLAAEEYNYILMQKDVPLDIKIRIGASYFNRSLKDSSLTNVTKEFFQTIDKDTTDWQVKMFLGAIAINEKQDSAAIEYFRVVIDLARWNSDAWVRLGGLYFDNRKYEEAVKVMDEAILLFPDDFSINLILGLSLSQLDKHFDAKPYLKKAVELNPNDMTSLSSYAFALSQLKENELAVTYLKQALKIRPDDVNLLGTLGMVYDAMQKWSECDSVYERALELDSQNALVNNNYAYSLSERGERLEEALNMVQIAVAADSLNTSYLDTIGWVYFKLGDYKKAKDYLEKAIEIGGESAVMLDHLGDIIFKLGEI
ncbi:MAG: tetratricopeptide repeat protein [Ignavibacteriaceae bacterium]|nr:tetratricopeptide repeat protein [Ignavibacteriaceae bacterium]